MTTNDAVPKVHQCKECGLHYRDEALAKRCEEWCSANRSCNLDIIKFSVESEPKDG